MKRIQVLIIPLLFTWGLVATAVPTCGQALLLSDFATGKTIIEAGIGDTLDIAILAELGRLPAAGLSLYVAVPEGPFEIIDQNPIDGTLAPFRSGPLFAGGVEITNCLLPLDPKVGAPANQRLLHYTTVLGPGTQRSRSGEGLVALFSVICRESVSDSQNGIFSSPIHETQMVMSDGSERLLLHDRGISISVDIDIDTAVPSVTWGQVKEESGPAQD